jgi:hypothetical protein
MPELGAHVRPEPIEAPEPQPVRQRDLVRHRALTHGYNVLCAEQPAVISYASFRAGVEAYELYRAVHDRRTRS